MGKTLKALTLLGCGWAARKCSDSDDNVGAAIFGAIALGAGYSLASDLDQEEREEEARCAAAESEEEDDEEPEKYYCRYSGCQTEVGTSGTLCYYHDDLLYGDD